MGVGRALVEAAVRWLESEGDTMEEWDGRVLAHAQVNVKGVWERLGFVVDERMGVWDEEGIFRELGFFEVKGGLMGRLLKGIDHCGMWRTVRMEYVDSMESVCGCIQET